MAKRRINKQMRKKYVKTAGIAGLLVLAQCSTAVMPVMAAEEKEIDVQTEMQSMLSKGLIPSNVADIFDAEYYMNQYPDLKEAFGYDPQALFMHFLHFGLKEGRVGSPILDIAKYRTMYPDLAAAFGNDWNLYVRHYFTFGIAEGRSSGVADKHVMEKDTGTKKQDSQVSQSIYYDSEGDVLIPWEVIVDNDSKEESYLTLESLRKLCGDTLVLLLDKDGNVEFVGGNFSSVKVTDSDSARESLQCMMKLLDFPEDTAQMFLTHFNVASNGDYYYRFSAEKKDDTAIYANTDIVVGADPQGNVLCLSSSSGTRYYNTDISDTSVNWEEVDEKFTALGYEVIPGEPVLKYNSDLNQYTWVKYYQKDGIIMADYVSVASQQRSGDWSNNYRFYKEIPTEDSYSFDYFFENDIQTQDMVFTDYFGNSITLPVAYEVGKGYYVLDKARKIAGVKPSDDPTVTPFEPYYFISPEQLESHFVSSIYTACASYDSYQEVGLFVEPVAMLIRLDESNKEDNAWCSNEYGAIILNINNHIGNASFDAVSHEIGHGVLGYITGGLYYQNATGAINESYADILGNLLEMITYNRVIEDGISLGAVDFEQWYIEEAQKAINPNWKGMIRNMSNPSLLGQPTVIGGKYYIIDTDNPDNENDRGGVHSNSGILNYICYRMYKDAGISLEQLFTLWYDTLQLLTQDSDYQSIQKYMEYNLRRQGLEDKIDKVNQFFEEANVENIADNWAEIVAPENTSKVEVIIKNLPDNVKLVGCSFLDSDSNTNNWSIDKNGQCMAVLDENSNIVEGSGDFLDKNIDSKVNSVYDFKLEYTVPEEDGAIVIDYKDVAAQILTDHSMEEDFSIPTAYENDYVIVQFILFNETSDNVLGWKIVLNREKTPQEDIDVTVPIQKDDWEKVDNDNDEVSRISTVLRNDSTYVCEISVEGLEEDTYWNNKKTINASDLENNATIHVIIPENGADLIVQVGETSEEDTESEENPEALSEEETETEESSEESSEKKTETKETPKALSEEDTETEETPEVSSEEETETEETLEESSEEKTEENSEESSEEDTDAE